MDADYDDYRGVEDRLRALAELLPELEEGDWLSEHEEDGQTFRQYQSANPVQRDATHRTIYLCLVGTFDDAQRSVIDPTREYLSLFFDVPVEIRREVLLAEIPSGARRKNPRCGRKQLLSSYLLRDLLEPDIPDDALAYLALTARDLWPGKGWNFVFGEANLRKRVGVWSIHRNGYPGKNADAFRRCLRRTLQIATHETCHVLTMTHCIAHRCLMNGCNSQEERDRQPVQLCPVCLRKLCWNLQIGSNSYLLRLGAFWDRQGVAEGDWYRKAAELLSG